MAQAFYGILTAIGEAKDANAKALGIPLLYTEMAVGDGGGIVPVPDKKRTTLINQKRRAPLNSLSIDPLNKNQVIAEQVIPESVGGWFIRELGLYDADGDLIAIANCPETYKPLLAEGSGRVQSVRMVIIVSSADSVQLKVDPSIILATREFAEKKANELMAAHEVKDNPHPQYFRTRKDILPGGLTQQFLRKKSNADNDWEWVDLTAGLTLNVNTIEESQLLAANQTVVDLLKVTTNGCVLHIGGARLDKGIDYQVNSQTRITLTRGYPKDTRLTAAQNEVAGNVVNPLDATKNLADVQDAATARKNIGAAPVITGTPQKWPTLDCPLWAVVRDGSALPRLVYPELFTILCPSRTATITQNINGAVVSGLSRTKDMWVGMPVEHAVIPAGATVKSIDSASQITLSANSTATVAGASVRLFFHGYGNGGNAATFGVMDDRGVFERDLDGGERGYEKSFFNTGLSIAIGSKIISGFASTRGFYIGQAVSTPNAFPSGTTIVGISNTTITVSNNSIEAGTPNLTVYGGQIGNERDDTFKAHDHGIGHGVFAGSGIFRAADMGQSTIIPTLPTGSPETRPRFRNYLPIIAI